LHAGDQMLALESLVLKYEGQQRESKSAGETLDRLLVEFHEGDHMICYDTLQKGGLLPKLKQARLVVQDAISNPFLKEHQDFNVRSHLLDAECRFLLDRHALREIPRLIHVAT